MKVWAIMPPLMGLAIAMQRPPDDSYSIILTGEMNGILTPCGCTEPMSGGMRRMATAVKGLSIPGKTILMVSGGLVGGTGRQDQLKLETLAQVFAGLDVAAINVGASELAMGQGALASLANLCGGKLVGSAVAQEASGGRIERSVRRGPLLIGGAADSAGLQELVQDARNRGLRAVLLLDGDKARATELAKEFSALSLIQYRSGGRPDRSWVGNTLLASPGEKGKELVRLVFRRGKFVSYAEVDLGPQYRDDAGAASVFRQYLDRVSEERLLEKEPRPSSAEYVGSAECGRCHETASRAWNHSAHAGALATLKREGENLDPDCVKCHVVGLDSEHGFKSESATPSLAAVGCESCHGAGKRHSASPTTARMEKVGQRACASCHTPEHSPNFEFSSFWPKIKH